MTHFQRYGRAYLVGIVFFVVTNAVAVGAVFGALTDSQITALTTMGWVILWTKVIALAGANVLAYLNQTVAKATQTPPSGPSVP